MDSLVRGFDPIDVPELPVRLPTGSEVEWAVSNDRGAIFADCNGQHPDGNSWGTTSTTQDGQTGDAVHRLAVGVPD